MPQCCTLNLHRESKQWKCVYDKKKATLGYSLTQKQLKKLIPKKQRILRREKKVLEYFKLENVAIANDEAPLDRLGD